MKLILILLAVLNLVVAAMAQPLRVHETAVDPYSFPGFVIIDLQVTGTEEDRSYTIERRTMPGPWSDFIFVMEPALDGSREYWRVDNPAIVGRTWYGQEGYFQPVQFFDNAPARMYRAKRN